MKLDPADVFGSAMSGVFARAALAWLAVWLGLVFATLKFASLEAFLLLPATILMGVLWGGLWALVTFPILCFLGYRAVRFVARGEGNWWEELCILLLLSSAVLLPITKVSLAHFVVGWFAVFWLVSLAKGSAGEEERAR
ncbi:hypothetical protein OKA04_19160 [Luteolibacter flavescens]|uniref:Uncharacterized protein n=1 Tax=Luteolibacter flavescens TaxID=1859460 RepID=A0ABT3FTV7_9BACT|nr:hypothetical protein [Luteolibacter flavescens]MCW1886867.1 hypothetical protein [Luteolibacter flavescens]